MPDEDGYDNRWVFKEDGTIEKYNDGKAWITFNYTVETNPSCSAPITVEPGLYYVIMKEISQFETPETNGKSGRLELCYELDLVNDDRLSLIFIGGPGYTPITFERFKKTKN